MGLFIRKKLFSSWLLLQVLSISSQRKSQLRWNLSREMRFGSTIPLLALSNTSGMVETDATHVIAEFIQHLPFAGKEKVWG